MKRLSLRNANICIFSAFVHKDGFEQIALISACEGRERSLPSIPSRAATNSDEVVNAVHVDVEVEAKHILLVIWDDDDDDEDTDTAAVTNASCCVVTTVRDEADRSDDRLPASSAAASQSAWALLTTSDLMCSP